MKYAGLALLCCLFILIGCKGKETQPPPDYSKPEAVIEAYYRALFVNDTDTAYNLIWERDRWFVFDDEFRAKYRINTFIFPELVADKFAYESAGLEQSETSARVRAVITKPDLTYLADMLSERLSDVSLPPPSMPELRKMVQQYEWLSFQQEVSHDLVLEDGRWYIYYDFETLETAAEMVCRADRLLSSDDAEEVTDAREKYAAALALRPDMEKARDGLANAEIGLSDLYDKAVYIRENMELLDFEAKDYQGPEDILPVPGITFKLRNNGDKVLDKIWVRVTFLDSLGRDVSSERMEPLHDFWTKGQERVLRPGETWEFSENSYYRSTVTTPGWRNNWKSGQARAEIINIVFTDDYDPQ